MAEAGSDKWQIEIAGAEAGFACPAGQTLLVAMIAAGRAGIAVGCRGGGCGVCRIRVTQGRYEKLKMTRSRISEADEAEGIVLACRILPHSNLAIEPAPFLAKQALA